MKEKIKNNWKWKLLSLLVAFFLWLLVVAYTDPTVTLSFEIPIEFENEDLIAERGKSVEVIGKTTVTIRVSKAMSIASTLKSSDFKAVADYSKMYQDTQVPVTVTSLNANVKDSEIEQTSLSVEVSLEDITSVTLAIEYEVTGSAASGYAIGEVSLSEETVTVTGPESFIKLVQRAVVFIDASGFSEKFTGTSSLYFYDGNGALLDAEGTKNVSLSVEEEISYQVSVMTVVSVPLTVEVSDVDLVSHGYRYTGYEISVDKIMISGVKSEMNRLSSIEITGLSVAGAAEDVVYDVDIRSYLPDGVTIYDDDYQVTIRLKVEELIEESFVIDVSQIAINNLSEGLDCEYESNSVTVTIQGLAEDLAQLAQSGLTASINLSGLESGEHRVVVLPILTSDAYAQVGTTRVTVQLTVIDDSEEDSRMEDGNADEATQNTGEE